LEIVHPMTGTELDQLSINTIRTLSIDAVQKANSGHPGTPMALAPLVYTIWNRVMRFDPQDPIWPNRDRFVLSNGHASMLLWSVLHLTKTQAVNQDYEILGRPSVSLDDIRHFRQLGSRAPGHPEYHWVSGVETTTGPLGQGVATSVGMAIGEKWLANHFNRPGFEVFDYNIYAVCGDGCMMEGVGSEAASLAGHLGLDNLCWIYDNNHITIAGEYESPSRRISVRGSSVMVGTSCGSVTRMTLTALSALAVFRKKGDHLHRFDSHIGYGLPNKQDTSAAHGEPLGDQEVRLCKRAHGWPGRLPVPGGVYEHFTEGIGARGAQARSVDELLASYRTTHPELARESH
jgi:transketolase